MTITLACQYGFCVACSGCSFKCHQGLNEWDEARERVWERIQEVRRG